MYCYQASEFKFEVELVDSIDKIPEGADYIEVPDDTEFDYRYMYYIDDETRTLKSIKCVIVEQPISPLEQLRADVDYLSAMSGVTL